MILVADEPKTLKIYQASTGRKPFEEWLDSLDDKAMRARILSRLGRVRLGNLGDSKAAGNGVCELRVNAGPGYRIYFGQDGGSIILLLCGGDKATQRKNITDAKRYWKDYGSRKDAKKRSIRRLLD